MDSGVIMDDYEQKKDILKKLHQIFDLGWNVGKKQGSPRPCSYDELRQIASEEFVERDRLIDELVKDFFSKGEA